MGYRERARPRGGVGWSAVVLGLAIPTGAMAQADPGRLRLSIGGTMTDLDRSAQSGAGGFGFGESNDYGAAGISAKLTMKIETRESISSGAVVTEGLLQLDRAGQDTVVVPVGGLIGCAT